MRSFTTPEGITRTPQQHKMHSTAPKNQKIPSHCKMREPRSRAGPAKKIRVPLYKPKSRPSPIDNLGEITDQDLNNWPRLSPASPFTWMREIPTPISWQNTQGQILVKMGNFTKFRFNPPYLAKKSKLRKPTLPNERNPILSRS